MDQKGMVKLDFMPASTDDASWAVNSGLNFSDRADMLEWFKKKYAGWDHSWYELFEGAVVPFIPRPIYCIPFDQTWQSQSNVSLIGDAAHVMPPFAGEGVNMAMLDALELSESLTNDKYLTIQQAIDSYESAMRERAAVISQESLKNGELMHSENALYTMLGFFSSH